MSNSHSSKSSGGHGSDDLPPPYYPPAQPASHPAQQQVVIVMSAEEQPPPYQIVAHEPTPFHGGPLVLYMIPENVKVRHGFIMKVYLILFAQLAFVSALTAALLAIKPAQRWMQQNEWMYIVAVCVYLVVMIVLICCKTIRRKWPVNIIMLLIFTAAAGYMTAVLASRYNVLTVLVATGVTAGCCLIVSLFSLQTRWDLTKWTGVLIIVTFSIFVFGIVMALLGSLMSDHFQIVHLVYSGIVVLVFVAWLAIDTQMLLGNKEYALTVDEYVFAALQLFLDVIYIFWHLLVIIGGIRGE